MSLAFTMIRNLVPIPPTVDSESCSVTDTLLTPIDFGLESRILAM